MDSEYQEVAASPKPGKQIRSISGKQEVSHQASHQFWKRVVREEKQGLMKSVVKGRDMHLKLYENEGGAVGHLPQEQSARHSGGLRGT